MKLKKSTYDDDMIFVMMGFTRVRTLLFENKVNEAMYYLNDLGDRIWALGDKHHAITEEIEEKT